MRKNIKIGSLVRHKDSFPFIPEYDKGIVLSFDPILDKCKVFWYINNSTSEMPTQELQLLNTQGHEKKERSVI
jgi:hypothetical protein